jgi:multiple sugar transport system ATP-binding protein
MLTGIIDVIEPTGPDTMVTIGIAEQPIIARLQPRFSGKVGETIGLTAELTSISFFDAETELRILL